MQLHGEEGPSFCSEVARRTGCRVIKAFRIRSAAEVRGAGAFRTDFHLFDAYLPGTVGGTGESFNWQLAGARDGSIPTIVAGGLTPENVGEAIADSKPWAVDVAGGVEDGTPGVKDHDLIERFIAKANEAGADLPDGDPEEADSGRSGLRRERAVRQSPGRSRGRDRRPLRPLRRSLRAGGADRRARRADAGLGRGARGPRLPGRARRAAARLRRPADAAVPARRLSERVGRRVYLKREDLTHTGAHKINNALGQALLAKRMGKRRIIAETGAGQHGVATATACALLGLECVVYMGSEDMRRQAPNVERMELIGAEVEPGRGRRAHAEGGGQRRDPRLGRRTSPTPTT